MIVPEKNDIISRLKKLKEKQEKYKKLLKQLKDTFKEINTVEERCK